MASLECCVWQRGGRGGEGGGGGRRAAQRSHTIKVKSIQCTVEWNRGRREDVGNKRKKEKKSCRAAEWPRETWKARAARDLSLRPGPPLNCSYWRSPQWKDYRKFSRLSGCLLPLRRKKKKKKKPAFVTLKGSSDKGKGVAKILYGNLAK